MAVFVVGLVLFLALAGYSDASYCVCNTGLSDSVLQKNIDYACGNGADCSQILQNGPCFQPNTVRDHCNYAVNSYYQRKGNIPGSCDFQGTATVTNTPPTAANGCVYPSSPSNGGSTTPVTPTTGGTPTPPTTGGTPTPPTTGGGTPTPPGTFPGGSTNAPGTVPGAPLTPTIGLGPTGSGFSNTDSSSAQSITFTFVSMVSTILIAGFVFPMF